VNLPRYTTLKRHTPLRKRAKRRDAQRPVTSLAKGRECQIRSPVCTFDDQQTVPCHVPDQCDTGIGHIAPELFVAWGCGACHALTTTGSYGGVRLERQDRDYLLLKGWRRTLSILYREGRVTCA
jgi:hypothetical protein